MTIPLLSRNTCLRCLFFNLLARFTNLWQLHLLLNVRTFKHLILLMLLILTLLYSIICLFFVCCSNLNMLVAGKRKYNRKTLNGNCKVLKGLEKRMSNKVVNVKYGVRKNTWVKSKEKTLIRKRKQHEVTKIENR